MKLHYWGMYPLSNLDKATIATPTAYIPGRHTPNTRLPVALSVYV